MKVENYEPLILDCAIGEVDDKVRSGFIKLLRQAGFRVISAQRGKLYDCLDPICGKGFSCRIKTLCKRYKPDLLIAPLGVSKGNISWSDPAAQEAKACGNLVVGMWDDLDGDPSEVERNACGVDLVVYRKTFNGDENYRNAVICEMKTLALKGGVAEATCISADGEWMSKNRNNID